MAQHLSRCFQSCCITEGLNIGVLHWLLGDSDRIKKKKGLASWQGLKFSGCWEDRSFVYLSPVATSRKESTAFRWIFCLPVSSRQHQLKTLAEKQHLDSWTAFSLFSCYMLYKKKKIWLCLQPSISVRTNNFQISETFLNPYLLHCPMNYQSTLKLPFFIPRIFTNVHQNNSQTYN